MEQKNEVAVKETAEVTVNGVGALLFENEKFERMEKVAEMMASGKCAIPKHLQGSLGDCFAVVMQAAQWGMNPFAVAQKTHVVNGALGYEAQLINAVVNSMHVISDRFRYEYVGDWEAYKASGFNKAKEAGCGVNVGATLRGESEVRWLPAPLCMEQVKTRNSPLWATNPQQQIAYLAVKYWTRLYAPDAILGVYSDDELLQTEPINVTPKAVAEPKKTASQRLKEKLTGQVIEAEVVEEKKPEVPKKAPTLTERIESEIKSLNAPITVKEIEEFLRGKHVIPSGKSLDDVKSFPADWQKYLAENLTGLVNAVAEVNASLI